MSAPFYVADDVTLHQGDASDVLSTLPPDSVQTVVTSPPYYGLRDYGHDGQIGLEASPAEYVARLVDVMRGVRRVLRPDGVLWLNLGDSYAGKANGGETYDRHRGQGHRSKAGIIPARINNTAAAPYKSLLGIPWRVAFALQDDGWIIRNDVIWSKPNAMPESVTDRLSSRHEHLFLLSQSPRYAFDLDPIREPLAWPDRITGHTFGGARKAERLTQGSAARRTGSTYDRAPAHGRNPGDVWTISTAPYPGAHFAAMPPALARRCIFAGSRDGDVVMDPFCGSGTTGMVARSLGRRFVGIDLSADYLRLAIDRIGAPVLDFTEAKS